MPSGKHECSRKHSSTGSTGEYSDRSEWVVEAHRTKEAAEARVVALEDKVRGTEDLDYHERDKAVEVVRTAPDGDPNCSIDYTGTRYWCTECPLR